MKREIAERIASTAVEKVTVEQARTIIGAFLSELSRCPVCDGSGTITFGRDVFLPVSDRHPNGSETFIAAGTTGSCPRCGSRDKDLAGKGDPDYVGWHCCRGDGDQECRRWSESDQAENRDNHANCGWRIVLPYSPAEAL